METRDFQYEAEVQEQLDRLIEALGKNEVIEDYKQIAQQVNHHEGLKQLVESIKALQKDAVQFAHYDKPEAEREAIRLADEKQREFDEHPLVMLYREKLIEANDLLQHVTYLLEKQVNQDLEEKLEEVRKEE
ncbi:YlbF family regulator [Vagococcus sp. DIV0080]|uniref:YlbF family regulator n=1 Tax=Candidatus Vagococcus giribetii TaxID=2230876 RepID=A0ABS3HS06_9ENTE|nr:YlbF family regulator [Vagococcus sp. DIV0080]MBO0476544.1 YlbF family regulator [Vagococcus sp. DIV0080]